MITRKILVPIGLKIGIVFFVLFFAAVQATCFVYFLRSREVMEDRILSDIAGLAESRKDYMLKTIEKDIVQTELVASRVKTRELLTALETGTDDPEICRKRLAEIFEDIKDLAASIERIEVADTRGIVAASSDPAGTGRDISAEPLFYKGMEKVCMSGLYLDGGRLMYSMYAPVSDTADEKLIGVLKVEISADGLIDVMSDYAGLGKTGEMILAEQVGDEIYYLGPLRHGKKGAVTFHVPMKALEGKVSRHAVTYRNKGIVAGVDYRNVDVLAAYQYMPLTGWGLVVKIDEEEAFEPVRKLYAWMLFVGSLVSLAGAVIIFFLAKFISGPIKKLEKGTEIVAGGDLDFRVEVDTRDEVGRLAGAFNRMTENLKRITASRDELDAEIARREKLEKIKDDFVNIVSHELRTPLATMQGVVWTLLRKDEGGLDERQLKFVTMLKNNIEMLIRITNSMLDLAKIEAGRMEFKKEPFDIRDAVMQAVGLFMPAARSKGIEIRADLPDSGVNILGDRDAVTRVFTNLISNAVKFTGEGYVEVSVRKLGDIAACRVADTGEGIATEDLPKVFSKYYQFGQAKVSGEKGTGLGLSIVKGIIDAHKGDIRVESEFGKGTKFIFTFPAQ
ncbi:MAG: sensor histidine kinase [Candidatus Omnitrophota bacterium]